MDRCVKSGTNLIAPAAIDGVIAASLATNTARETEDLLRGTWPGRRVVRRTHHANLRTSNT